ncbi:hypothetical protein C8Q74DRAFT_1311593 [Fomes fomentarius]|nr:hypothetical protein C8Q74DRAFT_1311593 [Fomes fomentarius]
MPTSSSILSAHHHSLVLTCRLTSAAALLYAPHIIPDSVMQMLHKRPCPFINLTYLMIERSCARIPFPPLMFGTSLIYLLLDIRSGISGSIIEATQCQRQLQYLEVKCELLPDPPVVSTESQAWRIRDLLSVLHAVQIQPWLMQLAIALDPMSNINGTQYTYSMDRDSFLNNILGCNEIKDTLRQFPALQHISWTVCENESSRYDKEWWWAEIVDRLQPDLPRTVISVHLSSEIWIHFLELLWCTQAEIDVIIAQRKAQQEEVELSISIEQIQSGGENYRAHHRRVYAPPSEKIESENHFRLSPSDPNSLAVSTIRPQL